MAASSEEVPESVDSDKMVDSGEASKADHEEIEMSDCQEGNVLASKDSEDVDMDGGEATEQSENLLDNNIATSRIGFDQTALAASYGGYGHYGCCENGVDVATILALLTGKFFQSGLR